MRRIARLGGMLVLACAGLLSVAGALGASRPGAVLTVLHGSGAIYVHDMARAPGLRPRRLSTPPGPFQHMGGAWSADGRLLAYAGDPGQPLARDTQRVIRGLHVVARHGSDTPQPRTRFVAGRPAWSADGRWLAAVTNDDLSGAPTAAPAAITRHDLHSGAREVLLEATRLYPTTLTWTRTGHLYALGPDGTTLLWHAATTPPGQGPEVRRFLEVHARDWRANDTEVLVSAAHPRAPYVALWRAVDQRVLHTWDGAWSALFLPDGETVLLARPDGDGGADIVTWRDGQETLLHHVGASSSPFAMAGGVWLHSLSPDGRWLAWSYSEVNRSAVSLLLDLHAPHNAPTSLGVWAGNILWMPAP